MDNVWARFFSHFLRGRSFKSRHNPRVVFFSGKKRLRRIQNGVFPFTFVEFCGQWIVYNSRFNIRVEEAVSWTQRFPTRKIGPKNEVYLWQTNLEANVCRNSTFQVNTSKNAICHYEDDVLPRGTESPFLSALHAQNDTTNLFGYKLGETTENNKALLFFSGK